MPAGTPGRRIVLTLLCTPCAAGRQGGQQHRATGLLRRCAGVPLVLDLYDAQPGPAQQAFPEDFLALEAGVRRQPAVVKHVGRELAQPRAKRRIAECDRKLAQYRAALDAGAGPATVAGWIAETEAEKQNYALAMRRSRSTAGMTEEEIKSVVDKLTDVIQVLSTANADDKSEIFRQLGLRLTYHPGRRIVEAKIEPTPHGFFGGVRGGT